MKKKILKGFSIALISLSAICGTAILIACGPDLNLDETYYSFFAPETSRATAYAPFYRSQYLFYNVEDDDHISDFNSKNVAEWAAFFKYKVSLDDLNALLYKYSTLEIDTLAVFAKKSNCPCSEKLKNNSLRKVKEKDVTVAFLTYLQFAKKCEPYAIYNAGWDWKSENTQNNLREHKAIADQLLEEGEKNLTNVRFDFIKQRYLFQLIRIYFLSGKFEEGLSFYQQHAAFFTADLSIKYRAMGYAAADLYKLEKYDEANYLYSLIYDQCELMKTTAFLSFHPQEEEDWEACLGRAKNKREKAILWQLLGTYVDPLRGMKEIYKLDPASDLMNLLLVRAINLEEERILPLRNSYEEHIDTVYMIKTALINKELVGFIKSVAENPAVNKPYLWRLAAGYMAIAQRDFKDADKQLAIVKQLVKQDTLILEQITALEIIIRLEQTEKPDEKFEAEMVRDLMWLSPASHGNGLRNESIYSWILKRLGEKYMAVGEIAKAQCVDIESDPLFYDSKEKMQKMLTYIDKPNKSIFEQYILRHYPYNKVRIINLLAVNLLYQYKFKEAVQQFEACPGSGATALLADPFIIHLNDCHDCDFRAPQRITYTQISFAKRMLELEAKIKSDPKNAAGYYFELANGYYNMSYFGNARQLYETEINCYRNVYWPLPETSGRWHDEFTANSPFLKCKQAEKYYLKAMELSTDKEFQAKCCFMAAKAEQNTFYITEFKDYKSDFKSGVYFNKLKTTFNKTKYYQEVIAECGYFRTFVEK